MAKSREIEDRYSRACELHFAMSVAIALSRGQLPRLSKTSEARRGMLFRWIAANREERWRGFDERLQAKLKGCHG